LVDEEGVTYVADEPGIIDPENVLAPLRFSYFLRIITAFVISPHGP